jgi:hypothetical protein
LNGVASVVRFAQTPTYRVLATSARALVSTQCPNGVEPWRS